ncbi:MAG: hypothetical protein KGI89_14875 [Euryarchaeota archaeon]|nr:hypothetical protein [Euryarchaeota archaeon]
MSSEVNGTVEVCPICDGQIEGGLPRCPSCGFPTALLPEARKAIEEEAPSSAKAGADSRGTSPSSDTGHAPAPVVLPVEVLGPSPPPASAAALNIEQTGIALQAALKIAQLLGMETADVASAMTQAAMAAAKGSTDESLKILQQAYDRMEPQIGSRFEALAVQLEEQEGRLREEGIAADVAREVSRGRKTFDEGARIEAVETLQHAQRAMNELENAWKQVKETLLRIDTLRETGQRLGMDLARADERLGQVRATLGEENLSAATLQEAGTQASATLVLLHEQVRNQIALLGQEAIRSLKAHPPPAEQREKAEARLKMVLAHARAGRLKEASDEMVRFRADFMKPATPRPAEEVAPAPTATVAARATASVSAPSEELPRPSPPSREEAAPVPPRTSREEEPSPPKQGDETPRPQEATPVPSQDEAAPQPPTEAATPPEPAAVPKPREEEPTAAPATPLKEEPPREEKRPTRGKGAAARRAPSGRTLTEIITEARDLGLAVRDRQKKKKGIGNAATLLKELTVLVKAGKAPEADEKLLEIRKELEEN